MRVERVVGLEVERTYFIIALEDKELGFEEKKSAKKCVFFAPKICRKEFLHYLCIAKQSKGV